MDITRRDYWDIVIILGFVFFLLFFFFFCFFFPEREGRFYSIKVMRNKESIRDGLKF